HLGRDGLLVRLEVVEIRSDRARRVRGCQGVTACAVVREDALSHGERLAGGRGSGGLGALTGRRGVRLGRGLRLRRGLGLRRRLRRAAALCLGGAVSTDAEGDDLRLLTGTLREAR